jgi:ADP-heptose:LPS heptosyltransferase
MSAARLLSMTAATPASFFSLQVPSDQENFRRGHGEVVDLAPLLSDFAETAAAIVNLDLVISVDTAVAHLAGALAKPVWLLLPFVPDWRWLLDRDDTPWYRTMRLFRQRTPGDWDEVIERVGRALNAWGSEQGPGW